MTYIELKGRKIPLIYTTYEMKVIQEEIGQISRAISLVTGRNPDDDKDVSKFAGAEHISNIAKMIKILGNAGLEENGEEPNLTEKGILRALRPSDLADVINICIAVINEGMRSEIPPEAEKPGTKVDVTLEEIEKKKETES